MVERFKKFFMKKIKWSDPVMSELINGVVTRRAVVLALIEGKQK